MLSNPGTSQAAIRHYDVGNEFYELFLDDSLTYSCAIFDRDDNLEAAQARKIDYHLVESRAVGCQRLLDVGCGWGGLMARAVSDKGVRSAVGLTLSEEQANFIRLRYRARTAIEVRLESWSDHQPTQPYDAVISIGAFEHIAKPGMSGADRIKGYRGFFERCHGLSSSRARLSLQAIFWDRVPREQTNTFITTEIFPETDLPDLGDIFAASKGLYEVTNLTTDRSGYVKTLNAWYHRLRRNKERALRVAGGEVYDRFERYFSLCAVAFRHGNMNLARATFAKHQ